MSCRQVDLGSDNIRDALNEPLSDDDVASNNSDSLEESVHDTNSELFGDDTDDDPDYLPSPEQSLDDTDLRQEPVTEDSETRVAPRCILGRRNKQMEKNTSLQMGR